MIYNMIESIESLFNYIAWKIIGMMMGMIEPIAMGNPSNCLGDFQQAIVRWWFWESNQQEMAIS